MQFARIENYPKLLEFYEALIPPVYPGEFPENFKLQPLDWALSKDIINRPNIAYTNPKTREPITIRPIGTMDVEFMPDDIILKRRSGLLNFKDNYYHCSNKCPGCFSDDAVYGDPHRLLLWREMFDVIDEARSIGLHSIKFLGPGEIFNNRDLFKILDFCEERNLAFSIFTKGSELGSDSLARHFYGCTAEELVDRLARYKCVRILLGFNSFDEKRQNWMVGSSVKKGDLRIDANDVFVTRGVSNYTHARNRALQHLVRAGFNDPLHGQRLSLIAAPIHMEQHDEIADMYEWAARRNIPLVIAPSMNSGPKAQGLTQITRRKDPDHADFIHLNKLVYARALQTGLMTRVQIEEEGISVYMGTHSCVQVANGLHIRLNGQVQTCPGTLNHLEKYGNVHETGIAEIWIRSPNYRMGASTDNGCVAKAHGTIPPRILTSIQHEVLSL